MPSNLLSLAPPDLPPYPKDPSAITRLSFERVDAACPHIARLPASLQPLARRMVHACANPEIVPLIKASENFVENLKIDASLSSLAKLPVLCDSSMLCAAIALIAPHAQCLTHCDEAKSLAREQNITRAMAGIDLYYARSSASVGKTIFLFGSAPTALFRLLEHCHADRSELPAATFAFPVGFVSALESKEALIASAQHNAMPYITLIGRLGGSAIAAAAFNAVFAEQKSDKEKSHKEKS